LLGRTFTTQWLEPTYVQDNNLNTLNSLEAYEQLKPQMDDISRSFKAEPGGKKKNPIKSISVGRKKTPSPPPKKKEEKKVDTTVLYAR
jgi:hypothetical protein